MRAIGEMNKKDVLKIIQKQGKWRHECLNMIASENITSSWVDQAYQSDFAHRYAEGVPYKRFYQGAKFIDELEDRTNKLFAKQLKAKYGDVRPISGAIANMAIFGAFTQAGDRIASIPIPAGAHSSHTEGGVAGLLGLKTSSLPFDNEKMTIDSEAAADKIVETKPKMVMLGASLTLFPFKISPIKQACEETGAVLVYDAAHVLGLIFAGKFQQPIQEGVDFLTSSTHKTFPGPQGGLIVGNHSWDTIQNTVFPGILSNHHLHRIPALLMAGLEMQEFGADYANQIIKNAKTLGAELDKQGLNILGKTRGYTESHQIVVDIGKEGGGRKVAESLESANIIANKNLLPWDKLSWETVNDPSGLRLGVQELTRFGMKQAEMKTVGELIHRVIIGENPEKVKKEVVEFRADFQKIHFTWKS
ncbi:MAG: aminotransferase class I/II-fold pyridoxal phosphate-dependent enzyme [Candidatus Altiarchaeota archaeon]|nr:aminotransferase class I/II-fold pyridoxal phosphate-dependent enzyme [Candidatus Altiarchaeota archaeon]